ncbi:MAG: hypothetical protein NXH70_02270 [Hyphomonas sp.]|nr:hypothetical protein [Hyphomonas sp.]
MSEKKKPICPKCETSECLVLETTGWWDSEEGSWQASDPSHDTEVWCNGGGENDDCDWIGYFDQLKWEADDGEKS